MTSPALPHDEQRQTKISLFGGIIVWFLALNVVYALPSVACKWGWFPFHVGPLSGLQFVQLLLDLLALAALAYLTYLPWRDWRRFQSEQPARNPQMLEETEGKREPMLAFIVMGTNAFFFLFALGLIVIILTLKPCG